MQEPLSELLWNGEVEGMSDEKKTPLEDLLKSLEGHVVDSVEIKGEHIRVSEGNEGDILHVRISATELDPKYPEHVRLKSKDLSFSILEADLLSRILGYFLERARNSLKGLQEMSSKLAKRKTPDSKLLDLGRDALHFIKETIAETLRIRKPVEEEA